MTTTENSVFRKEAFVCLSILLTVLTLFVIIGVKALLNGQVPQDLADETFYLNAAQDAYMVAGGLRGEHAWEAMHNFKIQFLKSKAPGTQLISLPLIMALGGAEPIALRVFGYLLLAPAAILLYFGLIMAVRPIAALAGTLFFLLSNTTLVTFLHWYQEVTAIPALCAAILMFIAEIRFGSRYRFLWLISGLIWGAGMYTKISYVFIYIVSWITLFVLSGWLNNGPARRLRLFWAGVTSYIVASFWWPTHFPYVLKYLRAGYAKHGASGDVFWEKLLLWLRSDWLYMYGFWGVVLFIVSMIVLLFAAHIFLKRRSEWPVLQPKCVTLLVIALPFIFISIRRVSRNNFNPRVASVIIPLAACLLSFAVAIWIKKRRWIVILVFILLALQGLSLVVPGLRPDIAYGDTRFIEVFCPKRPAPIDYGILKEVLPLPEEGVLTIGFVGVGQTFSTHAIKQGFFPDTHRVQVVNLRPISSTSLNVSAASVEECVDAALSCDLIVIPTNVAVSPEAHTPITIEYTKKENEINTNLINALSDDIDLFSSFFFQASERQNPDLMLFVKKGNVK